MQIPVLYDHEALMQLWERKYASCWELLKGLIESQKQSQDPAVQEKLSFYIHNVEFSAFGKETIKQQLSA